MLAEHALLGPPIHAEHVHTCLCVLATLLQAVARQLACAFTSVDHDSDGILSRGDVRAFLAANPESLMDPEAQAAAAQLEEQSLPQVGHGVVEWAAVRRPCSLHARAAQPVLPDVLSAGRIPPPGTHRRWTPCLRR